MAVTLRIDLNQISQSVSGNSSKVRVRVYATSTYGSFNNEKQPGWLKLNGVKYTFSHSFSANTTTLLYDTTRTIAHNSDGTKTVSATASYDTDVSSGTISASKSLKLTKINRRSQINSISNFTLENGTTISITKYVNNYTDMLQIYSGNTLIKTISNISNGHHVIFTQEELETLYGLSINSNNVPLKFKLTTYNGSSAVGSTETNTTGIIQISLPIITEILTNDVNDKTTTLTSDNQKYIKGYSILHCSIKAMAQKKAKINNFVIGDSLFNATYDEVNNIYYGEVNIEKINNNPVQVYAVDSRNNSASQMITLNFINYVPISKGNIEAKRENFTNEPVNISFNGTFWNNSFSDGQINNITAKYYYKNTSNSEWIQGNTNINITTDNNNFSFSGNIKGDTNIGFDINLSYNLRVVLTDKLDEVEFTSTINAGKPAIAIYKNNVAIHGGYDTSLGGTQINGDMFLNGVLFSPNNKVLWSKSTGWYMTEDHTATLSEKVSAQSTGIVLHWQAYSNGAVQNYMHVYTFIPKHHVENFSGAGINIYMFSNLFKTIGAKYIYVYDDKIVGEKDNDSYGTGNGITFDNRKYVLTEILGV